MPNSKDDKKPLRRARPGAKKTPAPKKAAPKKPKPTELLEKVLDTVTERNAPTVEDLGYGQYIVNGIKYIIKPDHENRGFTYITAHANTDKAARTAWVDKHGYPLHDTADECLEAIKGL